MVALAPEPAAGLWHRLSADLGVGIWGINIPVAWGFAITNYVWWIAIGMGGTFISAAFYLVRKEWRTSINRFAEAMTVFAVPYRASSRSFIWGGRGFSTGFSLSRHHEPLAAMAQLTRVGFFRHRRVSAGVDPVLVRGHGPGSRHSARPRRYRRRSAFLRFLRIGLARRSPPLAPLRDTESPPGRSRRATGVLGAQHGGAGFLRRTAAGLAQRDLSAVLRGWRGVLRLCDGADPGNPDAHPFGARGVHHRATSGEHGEDDAGGRTRGRSTAMSPRSSPPSMAWSATTSRSC